MRACSSTQRYKKRNYFLSKNCKDGLLCDVTAWEWGMDISWLLTYLSNVALRILFWGAILRSSWATFFGEASDGTDHTYQFQSFQDKSFCLGPAFSEMVLHYICHLKATLLKYSISEFLPSALRSGSASGMKREVFLAHILDSEMWPYTVPWERVGCCFYWRYSP